MGAISTIRSRWPPRALNITASAGKWPRPALPAPERHRSPSKTTFPSQSFICKSRYSGQSTCLSRPPGLASSVFPISAAPVRQSRVCAVDVRAIILVGAETEAVSSTSTASPNTFVPEQLVGVPIAALDLVGQPVVCHVIDRLRNCGVSAITVLSSVPAGAASLRNRLPAGAQHEEVSVDEIWGSAEKLFLEMSKDTVDTVLILRVGPYAEVDFNQLLTFHLARRNCATSIGNQFRQPLDIVALDR